jgi:hypothetical protein
MNKKGAYMLAIIIFTVWIIVCLIAPGDEAND